MKQQLLATTIFKDCVYLDKYIELIHNNISRSAEVGRTQRHHIIPVCYYKQFNLDVNNNETNLVNLLLADHLRAHCYLLLSSTDNLFKSNMFYAICFITGNTVSTEDDVLKLLSEDFEMYQNAYEEGREASYEHNPMFNEEHKKYHDEKMRSEDVRARIANSAKQRVEEGKLFNEEHRKNLSESAKLRCYVSKGTQRKRVLKTEAQKYVDEGWYCPYITNKSTTCVTSSSKEEPLFKRGDKTVWVHTDTHKKLIPECLLEEYLAKGWIRGSGMKMTDEHKAKLYSEESRAKISKALMGNVPGNKGFPVSEETKALLREKVIGTKWMNDGVIAKQVPPDKIDQYINNEFKFGRLPYDKKSKN